MQNVVKRVQDAVEFGAWFYTTPEEKGGANDEARELRRQYKVTVNDNTVGVLEGRFADSCEIRAELASFFGRTPGVDDSDILYEQITDRGGVATLDGITVEIEETER